MSQYYVVFEKPDGEKVIRDGYVIKFNHEYPTEEELMNAMGDILGGTDKGTIIFMQKLYEADTVSEVIDVFANNTITELISGAGEEKTDAEQQ